MDIAVKDLLAIIDAIPGVSVTDPKLLALVEKHKGKSTDYRITVDFFPPGVTITHLESGEGVRLPLSF
jgi:hypothetical protein